MASSEEQEEKVRAALGQLKVFPLPTAVLLPGTAIGLHVFEPRYRALARDALDGDGVFAIPMLAPGWESEYHGRPRLRPVAGAGLIERAERMPDGRYNLLVRGVFRVRITGEHFQMRPYREVRAEVAEETPLQDPFASDTLRRLLLQVCQGLPQESSAALAREAARATDAGQLCDVAAAALLENPGALQSVLEALDVRRRVELLVGELGQLLLKQGGSAPRLLS